MNFKTGLFLLATHGAVAAGGFAAGIYTLPILIAPQAPSQEALSAVAQSAMYSGEFRRDLTDSDSLHWGEGIVSLNGEAISHVGQLAPGPDYKLYLSPEFVETEVDFNRLKSQMVRVGDVKSFDGFIVNMSPAVDPARYNTVVIWCETFGEFISAAKYR